MEKQVIECTQYSMLEREKGNKVGIIWGLQLLYLAYSRFVMTEEQTLVFFGSYLLFWILLSFISKFSPVHRVSLAVAWVGFHSWLAGFDPMLMGIGFISIGMISREKIYSLAYIYKSVKMQTWKVIIVSTIYISSIALAYTYYDSIFTGPNQIQKRILLLLFGVLLGSSWIIKRWLMISSAEDHDESVLYLRSFDRDSELLNNDGGNFDIIGHIFSMSDRLRFNSLRTLERCIWNVLKEDYYINAIAKPHSVDRLIKSSTYHTDDAWQDGIESFLNSSQYIICMLDLTNGYAWEMTAIRNHQAIGKTLFIFPAEISLDQKNDLIEVLCHILGMQKVTLTNNSTAAFRFATLDKIVCYRADCQFGYFSTMGVLKTAILDLKDSRTELITPPLEAPRELKSLLMNLMKNHPRFAGLYYRSWIAAISGDLKWLLKLKRLMYRNISFDQFREYKVQSFFWLRTPEVNLVESSEIILEGYIIDEEPSTFFAYMLSNKYIHIQQAPNYYKVPLENVDEDTKTLGDVPQEVTKHLFLDYDLVKALKLSLKGESCYFRGWTYYELRLITIQTILSFSIYGILVAIIALFMGHFLGALLGLFFYVPIFGSCAMIIWFCRNWQSIWARNIRTGLCGSSAFLVGMLLASIIFDEEFFTFIAYTQISLGAFALGVVISPLLSRIIAKQLS
jgi:hypothetical protein